MALELTRVPRLPAKCWDRSAILGYDAVCARYREIAAHSGIRLAMLGGCNDARTGPDPGCYTLKEVGAYFGVSYATVSRALKEFDV